MDPVTVILTALITGAAAGLKPTAETAIKDAYEGLKHLIQSRFSQVDVTPIERMPDSKAKQDSVAEDLVNAGADKDVEVLSTAQEVIRMIESRAPEAATSAGITLERLTAASSINIRDLVAQGHVSIKDATAGGDLNIIGIHAGPESVPTQETRARGDSPNS